MGHMIPASEQSSWIELSVLSIRNNIQIFRSLLGAQGDLSESPQLGVVLKANAYGHGLLEMLSVVHSLVDIIHLISPRDALAVRHFEFENHLPRRRLLVLGAIDPNEYVQLAAQEVEVSIGDHHAAAAVEVLKARGLKVNAHVHIETGLSREGFFPDEIEQKLSFLADEGSPFRVKGVMSHFANTEDVTEQNYALEQLAQFESGIAAIQQLLTSPNLKLERHIAASAAALVLPAARCDSVRVGIALYGFWPSAETRLSARIVLPSLPKLSPVLSWKCRSQIVKQLSAGSYVGYGCTFRCERDTRIAVFPVGYFDGYPRLLSGRAHVLISGHRAPVLGRVMMNHIVVDVTGIAVDDRPLVATLLGRDGNEAVSAEMLASWGQTIHYEIVARIGAHLKRIVVDN